MCEVAVCGICSDGTLGGHTLGLENCSCGAWVIWLSGLRRLGSDNFVTPTVSIQLEGWKPASEPVIATSGRGLGPIGAQRQGLGVYCSLGGQEKPP